MSDFQAAIVEEIRMELERQAAQADAQLAVSDLPGRLRVSGDIDLEALAMAISGALAGGP